MVGEEEQGYNYKKERRSFQVIGFARFGDECIREPQTVYISSFLLGCFYPLYTSRNACAGAAKERKSYSEERIDDGKN